MSLHVISPLLRSFLAVVNMTRAASLVILAVLVLRLLLKRTPKLFSCLLWMVVLFRLLSPLTIPSPVSLLPEQEPISMDSRVTDADLAPGDVLSTSLRLVGDALNGGMGIQHIPTTELDEDGSRLYVTADWGNTALLVGQYVWITGAGLLALYGLFSAFRLRRRLTTAVPMGDQLWMADGIPSPFVLGLFRPRIYLPSNLAESERDYIVLHEQCHIRNWDPLFRLLWTVALCFHWFNPLVWVAFVLSGRDMELRCDEQVIRKLGPDIQADYAQSLLRFATGRPFAAPLAFGEADPKGRIRHLARWKRPAPWVAILAGLLCIAVIGSLATDPKAPALPEDLTITITATDQTGTQDVPCTVFGPGTPVDYDRVPTVYLSGDSVLAILLESESGPLPDTLPISVEYYEQTSEDAVHIDQDSYTLDADKDYSFILKLPHRHPDFEESVICSLRGSTGERYLFRLTFLSQQSPALPLPAEFLFASGAGSWGTTLTLRNDLSFSGEYSDADMLVRYYCTFEGQFGDLTPVRPGVWRMALQQLTLTTGHPLEESWDAKEDGTTFHYISSPPYGIEGGTSFLLCAPEASLDAFSEDFLIWRHWKSDSPSEKQLGTWAICNETTQDGFFLWES